MRVLLIIVLAMVACTSVRHYAKVAADAHVTIEKKSIIAPFVSTHFPPNFKVVRDTVIRMDTVVDGMFIYELSKIIDSLIMLPKDTVKVDNPRLRARIDSLIVRCGSSVKRTEIYTDTLYVTDAAKEYALSQFISSVQSENTLLKKEAKESNDKWEIAVKKSRSANIKFVSACFAALILLILLFKR